MVYGAPHAGWDWARFASRLSVCVLMVAQGCMRVSDPCPIGMVMHGKRCVAASTSAPTEQDPVQPVSATPSGRRADEAPDEAAVTPSGGPEEPPDAGEAVASSAMHDDRDASSIDAHPSFDGLDASVMDAAAAMNDGEVEASDFDAAATDATDMEASSQAVDTGVRDADSDGAVDSGACSEGDLATWRSYQVSNEMSAAIVWCYAASPACMVDNCDLGPCLRLTAGINGCTHCVADEMNCLMTRCFEHCRSSAISDICRGCACREHCVGTSPSCAMGVTDICSDCSSDVCTNVSLEPELIMRVFAP
jgi:hypothetical protein